MPLKVEIVSQEGPVFSLNDADMVILPGSEGEMAILPRHAALLTTLAYGELRVRRGNAEESLVVYGGVVEVHPDGVRVLADTADFSHEIDLAKAQAARANAERLQKEGLPPDKSAAVIQELRRASLQENVLRRVRSRANTVRIRIADENSNSKK